MLECWNAEVELSVSFIENGNLCTTQVVLPPNLH